ncbi:MAG: DNA polymerase III subunit gamma/tau [Bacilli bacterium]
MYQALYRKYRPSNFDEVIGQKVIIQTLKNAIKNNKISHAYLFTGPRGTGKTSIAKILAKTINCTNLNNFNPCNICENCLQNNRQSIDIIEIDAASNNGIDEIRELKSKINLVPSLGKYKIYIIDEVHMLTIGAFNALLKTLEEPPNHVIFVLATTEPHKIPITILSRCQRFDFKKISESDIFERIEKICQNENVTINKNAIKEIAKISSGGMRDSLSILDQVISYATSEITIDEVHEVNGTLTSSEICNFLNCIISNDINNIIVKIDIYEKDGKDYVKLVEEIIIFLKNILIKNNAKSYYENNMMVKENYDNINIENNLLLKYIKKLNELNNDLKNSDIQKVIFEIGIFELLDLGNKKSDDIKSIHPIEPLTNIIQKNSTFNSKTNYEVKKINNKIESDKMSKKLLNLVNIRINNTLCLFDKNNLIDMKNKLKNNILINNQNNIEIASLIVDSELKAFGNNFMIFVCNNIRITEYFNYNMIKIDEFLNQTFGDNFKSVAVSKDHWEVIKKEFNSKTKKYQFIEEPIIEINNVKQDEKKNEIETIFDDIIEYE